MHVVTINTRKIKIFELMGSMGLTMLLPHSVADPGCFIPDPDPRVFSSRISDPGS
jgi:hypothetical protein